ncbi:hypothetical protein EIN_020240 [Entamoeba invadens IP1]|uniref:hypothetical protein n=1 Tax=Entamoeba invadens IP1 TaxID=370355 RepID=UPI0002C3E92A|nr:hypothetical protein EIN_020240 [Entamoeba invadens IP1]ELP90575.1 hypothetical protein EIN_020240 [Entamoeba invadens IP1]|eukprot:XP_004257346.1 hypothetical protein EIN_020240 [Entamoeba invadens IP1]
MFMFNYMNIIFPTLRRHKITFNDADKQMWFNLDKIITEMMLNEVSICGNLNVMNSNLMNNETYNDLLSHIQHITENDIFKFYKIVPNQKGDFESIYRLNKDVDIDDFFKENKVVVKYNGDLKTILLHKSFNLDTMEMKQETVTKKFLDIVEKERNLELCKEILKFRPLKKYVTVIPSSLETQLKLFGDIMRIDNHTGIGVGSVKLWRVAFNVFIEDLYIRSKKNGNFGIVLLTLGINDNENILQLYGEIMSQFIKIYGYDINLPNVYDQMINIGKLYSNDIPEIFVQMEKSLVGCRFNQQVFCNFADMMSNVIRSDIIIKDVNLPSGKSMICQHIDNMVHSYYSNNKNEAPFDTTLKDNVQILIETDEVNDLNIFPRFNKIREEFEYNVLYSSDKKQQLFKLSKILDKGLDVERIEEALSQLNELKQKTKETGKPLKEE